MADTPTPILKSPPDDQACRYHYDQCGDGKLWIGQDDRRCSHYDEPANDLKGPPES